MTKEIVKVSAKYAPLGPYSVAVRAGDTTYLAGQLGIDPDLGKMVEGGVAEQCVQALKNVAEILADCGGSLADVVKATVFLGDISDWPAVNEIWAKTFSFDPPARSALQAGALPAGALIEVEVVAHIP